MNFSSLEYFQVLCQERNFTRASERLHLTQQSLSAHIAGLEKELGCQLIVRHVPLELTYGGKALLQYAESFLKAHEAMRREFCDISQNQKGVLRPGARFCCLKPLPGSKAASPIFGSILWKGPTTRSIKPCFRARWIWPSRTFPRPCRA